VDLLFLLNQATFALSNEMASRLAEVGLTPRKYCVLSRAMQEDLTQIRLAEASMLALPLSWRGGIELHHRPGRLYRIEPGSLIHRRIPRAVRAESMRRVRAAVAADPAVPWPVRAALPAVSLLHRAKVDARAALVDGAGGTIAPWANRGWSSRWRLPSASRRR